MPLNFHQELSQHRINIDNELNNFFNKTLENNKLTIINNSNIFNNHFIFNKPLLEAIKEFTLSGGKRIRPILVIKGFEAYTNAPNAQNEKYSQTPNENLNKVNNIINDVAKASICIELMQSSFLIHDDIMDDADTRRNKPTVHKLLGINQAICAGNIAMVLGEKAIHSSSFPVGIKLNALKKFNEIVEATNYGQVLELVISEKCISDVSEEEISQVMLFKTAKYTVEGPLHLGAILAGALSGAAEQLVKQLQELSHISIPLGIAFQIQDDILGIFADEKELGKSVYSDVQENKKTLLVLHAYNNSNPDQKRFIKSILGKKDITQDEFEELKQIIINTGSLDFSKKRAQSLICEAKNNVNKSSINKEVKEFLLDFAEYLIKREK